MRAPQPAQDLTFVAVLLLFVLLEDILGFTVCLFGVVAEVCIRPPFRREFCVPTGGVDEGDVVAAVVVGVVVVVGVGFANGAL